MISKQAEWVQIAFRRNTTLLSCLVFLLANSHLSAQGVAPIPVKSAKRGIAYGSLSAPDLQVLSPGISWWYNWSNKPEVGVSIFYQSLQVEFVPMVWGGTPDVTQTSSSIPFDSHYLLGFNEPNFTSQANKTPAQAAELWPQLEKIAAQKNLKIVAPAVNYCDKCVSENGVTYTDPVNYLDAFFKECANCKVDYIAVHWYACDVGALKWYIDRFKKYNKPIWLTEFSCGDLPHDQITLDKQKEYMIAAVKYLENEPAIFRYSWFSGRNTEIPFINLLAEDGKLTELGQLYISLPATNVISTSTILDGANSTAITPSSNSLTTLSAEVPGKTNVNMMPANTVSIATTITGSSGIGKSTPLSGSINNTAPIASTVANNNVTASNTGILNTTSASKTMTNNTGVVPPSIHNRRSYSASNARINTVVTKLDSDLTTFTTPNATTSSVSQQMGEVRDDIKSLIQNLAVSGRQISQSVANSIKNVIVKIEAWYKQVTSKTNNTASASAPITNTASSTPQPAMTPVSTPVVVIPTPPSVLGNDTIPVNYKADFLNFTKLTAPAPYPANTQTPVPLANPVGAEGYTPLYAPGTPVKEVIQYSEPDGTLVTLNGFRAVERHAREWGEDWFLNEADNAANNWNNADKQPGRHLTFPAFYFQNRTFGMVVRDEVPAGRSRIATYFKANQVKMYNLGMEGFHSMNPLLQGFGWAALAGSMYIPDTTFKTGGEKKAEYCPADAGPFDCISSIVFLSPYNNDNCDPSWSTCEAKPIIAGFKNPDPVHLNKDIHVFSQGDLVELSTAIWLNQDPHFNLPGPDAGGIRYYSQEKLYVTGKGVVPWYGVIPRTNAVPLPDSALSGGGASVTYNFTEEPYRLFQQAAENIGIADMQRFVEGRRLFHTSFLDGKHSEHADVNPIFKEHVGQLGARFNNERCLGCHAMDGRSLAPQVGSMINTLSVMTAATSSPAGINPDPAYGLNIQQLSQDAGAPNFAVKVNSFQTVKTIILPGGDTVELQKPVLGFSGPVPAQYSVRQAPQVIGMGLLEAIDESIILSLSDPNDANGDGVRGAPNWVIDPETGLKRLGRFGWKASKGSLRHQIAGALMLDMGVTTPVFPTRDCQKNMQSAACKSGNKTAASVNDSDLTKFVDYLSLLGVPAQRSVPMQWEGTNKRIPYIYRDVQPTATTDNRPAIQHGSQIFAQLNCVACHRAELKTGNNHPFAEVRNQLIHPYTDLLLHDMGIGLADTLTEGNAQPQMWRTQPLWGLGLLPFTAETQAEMDGPDIGHGSISNARYLHDGRARTLLEAIEWHDGEAAKSRIQFEGLSKQNREDLLTFLRTL